MKILAIANQKGGTAKTTTSAALAVLWSRRGVPVHIIDMDPQASLTLAFGVKDDEATLLTTLKDGTPLPVVRLAESLTITPSNIELSRAETEFTSRPAREGILKRCLAQTGLSEDTVVILDCPPSLGLLAVNCLTAADQLCVVVQPGGFELHALAYLEKTVRLLKEWVNPELAIAGAVLTNCHTRRSITEQVAQEVSRVYPLLGRVRAEAQLLYATTAGTILTLRGSKAMADYELVKDKLEELLSCPQNLSPGSAPSLAG